MKKIKIMDYEQKYKEALKRASNLHKDAVEMENNMTTKTCEIIFPELKESWDEKMRESIIYALRNGGFYSSDKTDEAIAWLEKQGHMLSPDKVVEWLECKAFQGWAEEINIKQIVDKFKKDFGL